MKTIFLFPFLVAVFLVFVDYSLLVDRKMRLQVAADRAVFAGAARLAHLMNKIAKEGRDIHDAFAKVEKNALKSSWQAGECENRIKEMKNFQQGALDRIDELIDIAYEDANAVAYHVADANYPGVGYQPLYGNKGAQIFTVVDSGKIANGGMDELDSEGGLIRKHINCGNIEGIVFDPSSYKANEHNRLLRYIAKGEGYVALISKLSTTFSPPFLKKIFPQVKMEVVSAAQPYGGSIKQFALSGDEKLLFRPSLVPAIAALQMGGEYE